MKKLIVCFLLYLAAAGVAIAQGPTGSESTPHSPHATGRPATSAADIHVDFTQVLKDIDGQPIIEPDGKTPMTLSWVACRALEAAEAGDVNDKSPKLKFYQLEAFIHNNKNAVLTVDDAQLIIDRIGKLSFGSGLTSPAILAIDKNAK